MKPRNTEEDKERKAGGGGSYLVGIPSAGFRYLGRDRSAACVDQTAVSIARRIGYDLCAPWFSSLVHGKELYRDKTPVLTSHAAFRSKPHTPNKQRVDRHAESLRLNG